ncbi:MAG: HXXEE domain-containing protein [Anaerolineales bacterium]|nr:HXXEE domain-containing protein [Anaerolineales bacterium]
MSRHAGLGIRAKRWYNPGLATAWLLHVPFAIWAILLLQGLGCQNVRLNLIPRHRLAGHVVLIAEVGSDSHLPTHLKHRQP